MGTYGDVYISYTDRTTGLKRWFVVSYKCGEPRVRKILKNGKIEYENYEGFWQFVHDTTKQFANYSDFVDYWLNFETLSEAHETHEMPVIKKRSLSQWAIDITEENWKTVIPTAVNKYNAKIDELDAQHLQHLDRYVLV